MTLHPPLWAQNTTYPALADRRLISTFDPGTFRAKELNVSPRAEGAAMSVDISAGSCIIPGPSGSYLCVSDEREQRPIGAAPATGTSRHDLIVARVYDPQATGEGSGDAGWDIEVVPGAAAPSPSLPATPAWSIPLASVLVAAGTVSITASLITDRRRWATAAGTPIIESQARGRIAIAGNASAYIRPPARPGFWDLYGANAFIALRTGTFIFSCSSQIGAQYPQRAHIGVYIHPRSMVGIPFPASYASAVYAGGASFAHANLVVALPEQSHFEFQVINDTAYTHNFDVEAACVFLPAS